MVEGWTGEIGGVWGGGGGERMLEAVWIFASAFDPVHFQLS